ncbi:unnamed protein product [Colletotrichum noveboracense]|uniref:F-box domain-containing protein n=1 Tax=Colletotrichum noveboracense TaxID=2664923 RepID=A0A9W4RNA3_9PEZI|nr:unnamed protein product [Colletotrichum noveboracense]
MNPTPTTTYYDETRIPRRKMNTLSMTAGATNGANNNTDGATKQRRRAKKTRRTKRTKREDPATKRYRLKSLDLQQKIRLALEARRIASLTNPQIPREFHPSFRGSGEQVLKQIEARPPEFDASTGKRVPSARSMLGKGGILPPEGLNVEERSAWHKAHNALWETLSERERCEMKQQQTSNGHFPRKDAPKNDREDDIAREQEAPKAAAAQEGIDSVRTSNKRARSPEGSEASSDSFYYDAEDFISGKESATMPLSRKRVRFNGPEPTVATEKQLAQRRDSREATAADEESFATRFDGPESGEAAQESLTSGLEVLELAEESLAPRVFVTPNPNVNQPFIRVVTVDSEAELTQKVNDGDDTPVSYFDFGPEFQLSEYVSLPTFALIPHPYLCLRPQPYLSPSSPMLSLASSSIPISVLVPRPYLCPRSPLLHIHEILLRRPWFFQSVVQITAGSPEFRLSLTDIGLVRLVSACPILENLSIHGGIHLSDRSVAAVISKCKYIRHLAICGADFEPNNVYGAALHQLVGTPVATNLNKIVLKNTKVYDAMVKRLRDERPGLKISHSG